MAMIPIVFSDMTSSTDRGLFKKPHRPLDCLPRIMSARHVAGVVPGVAQRRGCLASNVEAVDTECDDGFGLGKGTNPVVQAFGVAPDGAFHDILRLGGVVFRARIDDLNRS